MIHKTPPRTLTLFGTLLLAVGCLCSLAIADSSGIRPRILVDNSKVIKGDVVYLGDISRIYSTLPEHEELVDTLKTIKVMDSPPPKTKVAIPGLKILSAMKQKEIPLESIGYSIPQMVSIERAGRALGKDEVLNAVREMVMSSTKLDMQVREIMWDHAQIVPVGSTIVKATALGQANAGKLPLRIAVLVDQQPAARFIATAIVDDWREVPVLNRTLDRGMLISPEDVDLVRLNLFKQPFDIVPELNNLVGRRVKTRIQAGETVRKSLIDVPPVVPRGKKVVIRYQAGTLLATATGVAMEDGHKAQVIKIKNENSRKVVRAKVISPEQVEVVR